MRDLVFMTATELAPMIEAGEVSPVELTQQFHDRIEKLDSKLKPYIRVLPEQALLQAKKAEEEFQKRMLEEGAIVRGFVY